MISESKNRRWALQLLTVFFGTAAILVFVNVLVDPYDYFGVGPWRGSGITNERLWKPQYVIENESTYNALHLGSSTASQVYPSKIEELLPHTRLYNLGLSGGNLYDYEFVLAYLLEQGFTPDRIVVQIDLTATWMHGIKPQYYKRYGPNMTGENKVAYYAGYLFRFHQRGTITKLRHRLLGDPPLPHNSYDSATGIFYFPHRENLIAQDHTAFMAAYGLSDNQLNRVVYGNRVLNQSLESLQKIVSIAQTNGAEVTLIVSPHNYNLMNGVALSDYVAMLRGIAEISPFWDFSGYNSVTLDSQKFYDRDHFRPDIGNKIVARVFGSDASLVPDDFGVFLDSSNVEERVRRAYSEFAWADREFAPSMSEDRTLDPSWPLLDYLASDLAPEFQ